MQASRDALVALAAARSWAMERRHLLALVEASRDPRILSAAADFLRHLAAGEAGAEAAATADAGYTVSEDGIALVQVTGTMVKVVPPLWKACGCNVAGTAMIGQAVAEAYDRPDVKAVLLYVDSPGGEVGGVQEAADQVRAVAQRGAKPVWAAISDLGASAAYWLASQASRVAANATAHVGSIGVYTWVEDTSEAARQAGVTVHLVASGPEKGVGVDGVPILPEQLAGVRENVQDIAAIFTNAVAEGRRLPLAAAEAVSTGRTWIAPRALRHGLVDAVENFEETVAQLRAAIGQKEKAHA